MPHLAPQAADARGPALKLHATLPAAANVFTSYGDDYVAVNGVRHDASIVVLPDGPVLAWPVPSFDALTVDGFERIAALGPEVVVFGSGPRIRFPHPRLTAPLAARGIGIETMDMHAACRTFNILVAEGRRVAAALIVSNAAATAASPSSA